MTLAAASGDVGAHEAADATCAGDDGVADIASRFSGAYSGTETLSPDVGAISFTRRVERYPAYGVLGRH